MAPLEEPSLGNQITVCDHTGYIHDMMGGARVLEGGSAGEEFKEKVRNDENKTTTKQSKETTTKIENK